MRRLTYLLSLLLIPAFLFATNNDKKKEEASSWRIDNAHSLVKFSIEHFFVPVTGTFSDYNVSLNFDPENLAESSINAEIAVNSVNSENEKRDAHLQSPDFFHAEKFPKMVFKSTQIKKTGEKTYVAVGDLTIRDVTKTVELPFTFLGAMENPMNPGNIVGGITSELTISRNDFGVGSGSWAATAVVGEEVTITINLEVHRKI